MSRDSNSTASNHMNFPSICWENPALAHRCMKPRQVREFFLWCFAMKKHLFINELDSTTIYAGDKADGHTAILKCQQNGMYEVIARTAAGKVLLSGYNVNRYVTQLACDLQPQFTCELRALYDGVELGFLEVLAMLKKFKENHLQNTGLFQLQICLFGVYSVNPDGCDDTGRACSFLSQNEMHDFLSKSVVPGNPLVSLVNTAKYRVRLYDAPRPIANQFTSQITTPGKSRKPRSKEDEELNKYELEFQCNVMGVWQTVARSPQEFFDFLIAKAAERGIEGFVLKADPSIFKQKQVVMDAYGIRDQSAVKVKQEFKVTLLACKIRNINKKKSLIFTYGVDAGGKVVYAGEHTDHKLLDAILPGTGYAFSFKTKAQKELLYQLDPEQIVPKIQYCIMVNVSCTNMSKNRFCPIGLKYHDMKSMPIDMAKLSNLKQVAEANPHFLSTKAASDRFAAAIGRGTRRAPVASKRVHRSFGGSPVPERRVKRHQVSAGQGITEDAPQSLDFNDFMVEMGESWQPDKPEALPTQESLDSVQAHSPVSPSSSPKAFEDPTEKENKAFEGFMALNAPNRARYRVLPSTVSMYNVYIDRSALLGPQKTFILKNKIFFLGGTIVQKPGPTVGIVVSNPAAINRLSDHLSICYDLKAQCSPNVRFTTPDAVQDLLRP